MAWIVGEPEYVEQTLPIDVTFRGTGSEPFIKVLGGAEEYGVQWSQGLGEFTASGVSGSQNWAPYGLVEFEIDFERLDDDSPLSIATYIDEIFISFSTVSIDPTIPMAEAFGQIVYPGIDDIDAFATEDPPSSQRGILESDGLITVSFTGYTRDHSYQSYVISSNIFNVVAPYSAVRSKGTVFSGENPVVRFVEARVKFWRVPIVGDDSPPLPASVCGGVQEAVRWTAYGDFPDYAFNGEFSADPADAVLPTSGWVETLVTTVPSTTTQLSEASTPIYFPFPPAGTTGRRLVIEYDTIHVSGEMADIEVSVDGDVLGVFPAGFDTSHIQINADSVWGSFTSKDLKFRATAPEGGPSVFRMTNLLIAHEYCGVGRGGWVRGHAWG